MPDRDESTPAAPIPRIDPASWEAGEGLRETLLLHFTDPEANEALRRLGDLLFDLSLLGAESWPHHPEGETRAELRAALADLRHLEGFLGAVGREDLVSSLNDEDSALSQFAAREVLELRAIADRIEAALGAEA
ncbi:MAG: hypothetical protein JF614_09610 [Acidobacteria bacterium]|nr:hypothetical protein [Acidobacteriota bacterium]